VFILTEHTPNPDALKFVPHVALTCGASHWCASPADAPLAAQLFALEGVRRVFIAPDFVTVTRAPDGPGWADLRYAVISVIPEFLEAGEPALAADASAATTPPDDDEIASEIRQVLGLYVRPGVARDGGDVLFERFEPETGIVWVKLQGACGGCPSSRLTLKSGIEQILRRYIPEVLQVEEVVGEVAARAQPRWAGWAKAGAMPRKSASTLFTHSGQPIKSAKG
jgi:NFU1 iron-sulfur cluster scaffold homolog, mitochondrial